MNFITKTLTSASLLTISFGAYAISQEQITEAVTFAISDMDQLSSDLIRCNAQIEKYRSSRAMQTDACLYISASFKNHLESYEKAVDMLTKTSLDVRVGEEVSKWWESQKKLSERLKNSKTLLETDMHRHMEMIKKYRIKPTPNR